MRDESAAQCDGRAAVSKRSTVGGPVGGGPDGGRPPDLGERSALGRRIQAEFRGLELPPIEVLEVPDVFAVMDPELIEILRAVLDPEFEQRLRSWSSAAPS